MIPTEILSRPVAVASIPPGGIERAFSASDSERAALAKALGLLDLKALTAEITVAPEPKGALAVTGRVKAEIVQACVVTLEPVAQSIDEPVEVRFIPAKSAVHKPSAEFVVSPGEADPPEILTDAVLDLGRIAAEHFVLAIDPYPRAPGAELPPEAAPPKTAADSPFAALAGLRDRLSEDR